ncbi:glycosyltransferase [Devosia naphthalenivorans]|uniref:glycosyltransferase n=1 Tax=Devosia naphthalenivorans TaxID=2082392 RepID=UPI000D3DC048|nr:glycosyltransferase [Devosia naphthalenivorans]
MTFFVISLEPYEQRYTSEWVTELPKSIAKFLKAIGSTEQIRVVEGHHAKQPPTRGAFLNFAETNIFKAAQIGQIADLFTQGTIVPGDKIIFADAWHPGVINTRYMSDLLGNSVRLIGLWHAGSYDQHDYLGRIPDTTWARHFERSLFHALDVNCFATQFHIDLFKSVLGVDDDSRILLTGWPMDYLETKLAPYRNLPKRNLVLFPHRIAPEKQVEIFRDLAGSFPDYEFRVCQDTPLTKAEYHQLLGKAKMVFSASLQETLGIGLYEGLLCGATPFAPDRLSYKEMYPAECLYPSAWTESWDNYIRYKPELVQAMEQALSTPPVVPAVDLGSNFFSADVLMKALVDG